VVAKVTELMLKEAREQGIVAEVVDREEGTLNRTLLSAVVALSGTNVETFARSWEGVIQWIAQSPYRKYHRRKNWFVGVQRLAIPETPDWNERDIQYQTLKASGPGGQHVNKTETAVRAIHLPSGICVTASDSRSQLQNKHLATERLLMRLAAWKQTLALDAIQTNWQNHNELQRGNPVRVIKMGLE
jgi:peptide chain release factor